MDLSKKEAENEFLKDQLELERQGHSVTKSEVMELKDIISKKEGIIIIVILYTGY